LFDIEARNAFETRSVNIAMIKCSYGFNLYGLRVALLNSSTIEHKYLRCSSDEMWEYVTKFPEIRVLRINFAKDLIRELESKRTEEVRSEEILSLVKDILRYFDNEEEDEHETNQSMLGVKEMFWGYIAKV